MPELPSSSPSPHSSQPSAPSYDQQPPLKRVKDDAVSSSSSTPSSSSSSARPPAPGRRLHLKPAEESLPIEEQEKIIRRRAKDAERKRRDRERAKRAAQGLPMPSDDAGSSSSKPSPSSSVPSTPTSQHFHATSAARSGARPTPTSASAAATSTDDLRASETAAAIAAATSAAIAAEKKAKSAADRKAAAERRAAAAAEKLAAERAALLAAEQEAEEEEAFDEDEEDQKLYCICRTLYDEERMMVACDHDRCGGEWYHTDCMGMDDEMVALVDVFICPRCEPFTTERTTMKPPCLRQDCKNAARPPLSRYCSDRCGILVAAARIAKTKFAKQSSGGPKKLLTKQVKAATRREGMVVWGDAAAEQEGLQRWFENLCVADDSNDDEEEMASHPQPLADLQLAAGSSRDEERLVDLRRHLAHLTSQRQEVSTALDLAESRVKLLQLVDDRLGVLPPVVVEDAAPSTSKKSKSKGGSKKDAGGAELKTQPRCGYDERLSWDDERFSAWMASEEGKEMLSGSKDLDGRLVDADGADVVLANGDATETAAGSSSAATAKVCGVAKRKCKRHAEWNVVRTDDFEVEKDSQTSALSTLSEEISRTNAQIADLEATLQAKRTTQDARANGTVNGADSSMAVG